MRRFFVLMVLAISILSLAQINFDVFGSYAFTISGSPTEAVSSITYVSGGIQAMYEVSEGVEIGGGVGIAYFLAPSTSLISDFLGVENASLALDVLASAKYSLPIDDFSMVTIRGYGGISLPGFNFQSMGYVVGIGVYYTYDMIDFKISAGGGIEMRTYGTSNCTSIPLGVLGSFRF